MNGLRAAAKNLKVGGVHTIFVDGSFTTNKETPDDIDGCWDPTGADPKRIDEVFWNCVNEADFHDRLRPKMKAKYGLDFFIMGDVFPDFFRRNREGMAKGIIRINLDAENL